jgi:uncharacterized protein DUF3617
MDNLALRSFLLLFVVSIAAQAQTALPIKAGLWQIHIDREVNGEKAPDMSEKMKNMDPETRARVEAMMKQRGIDVGASGGPDKVCYSKEMIQRGRWADQQTECKTDFNSQSAALWKWHSSCPKLGSESDGEATFSGSENYVVKTSSVTKLGGTSRASHMTITGKWMSSDCGDLKPMDLKP